LLIDARAEEVEESAAAAVVEESEDEDLLDLFDMIIVIK
jgi:hypothetical protein